MSQESGSKEDDKPIGDAGLVAALHILATILLRNKHPSQVCASCGGVTLLYGDSPTTPRCQA